MNKSLKSHIPPSFFERFFKYAKFENSDAIGGPMNGRKRKS